MEILSTGEKIKRARVYKGITLKELCRDRISISKMSCIENGKIKADEESLKYIAEKLQIDYNYLTQDVYEQIKSNIENIKTNYNMAVILCPRFFTRNLCFASFLQALFGI